MSDNIPFDIQREIIKKVSDVKSLVQFRSVSKPWKSFIDSAEFIKGYGARHTQPHSRILTYKDDNNKFNCICLVDDDNEPFKVQKECVVSPFLNQYGVFCVIGACHGLLCLRCYGESYDKEMVIIWNPSIRKSFGISLSRIDYLVFGFGVCPVNRDPTVVKILWAEGMPRHVEVFTLSSGVWNVIPCGNLLRESVTLNALTQVVIDRFIYWGACEETFTDDGESTTNHMVVSFDLITNEFKVIDLPDNLNNELDCIPVAVAKLRESLVVCGSTKVGPECSVWVMEHDSSFRKLFTVDLPFYKILGFRNNGEHISETQKEDGRFSTLDVYGPCSQQIKNIGISGQECSFFMDSYKESLLLLDHLDSRIYYDNN